MDKKITFTGGEPAINWDDLNRDETANRAALFGIMKAFNIGTNENFIISGCEATVDTGVDVDVTAGYIFLNGEILQVDAQTVANGGTLDLYKYTKEVTYDPNGDKTYNDSTARQTWQKNRGKVEAATAPILGTELDVVSGDRLVDKIISLTQSPDIDWVSLTNSSNIASGSANVKQKGDLVIVDGSFTVIGGFDPAFGAYSDLLFTLPASIAKPSIPIHASTSAGQPGVDNISFPLKLKTDGTIIADTGKSSSTFINFYSFNFSYMV